MHYESIDCKSAGCPVSTHAEMNLLKRLNPKLANVDILVIRVSVTDKIGSSRPCYHCILRLVKTGVRYVYYSTEAGTIVRERVRCMLNSPLTKASSGYRNKNLNSAHI